MSQQDRLDPESAEPLIALLSVMPGGFNAIPDIVERRAVFGELLLSMTVDLPPNSSVLIEDRAVSGPTGAADLAVRIYRPVGGGPDLPGLYFIHGGGMVMGDLDTDHLTAAMLCESVGAVVVSVDYRLAPEHPAPAAIEDCYAGLVWMAAHASDLGFDVSRLGVYGASAGGGLAIASALVARDRGGPALAFLMPIYPMIDDRNESASSHEVTDVGVWDRAGNIEAWGWYLAGAAADQYSAPARAADLSGLPPTFIDVGEIDLFRDEDIDFARRLLQAGVPTELHVWPGAYHGSDLFAPAAALSVRIWARRIDALTRALT